MKLRAVIKWTVVTLCLALCGIGYAAVFNGWIG
mgnify:FL=1